MANIYISYSRTDTDFALSLVERLRAEGHQINIDFDTISAGQDWRKSLSDSLKKSEVFIALLSNSSLRSQSTLLELGAARAYSAESDQMLIVPIVIDDVGIPSVVQDIQVVVATDRNLDKIVTDINKAISAFIGRRAAREEKAAEVAKKLETNASTYVDDAIQTQRVSEARNRLYGMCWYVAGFCALIVGLGFAVISIGTHSSAAASWPDFGTIALKSILVIGLLGACSKYAFSLGKSYVSEALKCADRIHAIAFGKFYLQAYGQQATWAELKEVFQHWNIDRTSSFASLDAAHIDPQVLSLIGQVASTAVERVIGKKA